MGSKKVLIIFLIVCGAAILFFAGSETKIIEKVQSLPTKDEVTVRIGEYGYGSLKARKNFDKRYEGAHDQAPPIPAYSVDVEQYAVDYKQPAPGVILFDVAPAFRHSMYTKGEKVYTRFTGYIAYSFKVAEYAVPGDYAINASITYLGITQRLKITLHIVK